MNLDRYHELMHRLTKGDRSVLPEIHELQAKMAGQKPAAASEPEAQAAPAEEPAKKPRKKKEA